MVKIWLSLSKLNKSQKWAFHFITFLSSQMTGSGYQLLFTVFVRFAIFLLYSLRNSVMAKTVESVCSNSCWEVRCTSDTEADKMHTKNGQGWGNNNHFLQGKKHLNVFNAELTRRQKVFRHAMSLKIMWFVWESGVSSDFTLQHGSSLPLEINALKCKCKNVIVNVVTPLQQLGSKTFSYEV